MGTQIDLYGPEDLKRLDRRIVWERVLVWGVAALTLGLCVLFCCLTTTRNAGRMELYTLITSCLGGWLVIYRRIFGLQESKHEREHARYLNRSERSEVSGKLGITRERMRIRNSIRFRILTLDDGEMTRRLKVNENRVRALKPYEGKNVTLVLAGGYVAGIGGDHADR